MSCRPTSDRRICPLWDTVALEMAVSCFSSTIEACYRRLLQSSQWHLLAYNRLMTVLVDVLHVCVFSIAMTDVSSDKVCFMSQKLSLVSGKNKERVGYRSPPLSR